MHQRGQRLAVHALNLEALLLCVVIVEDHTALHTAAERRRRHCHLHGGLRRQRLSTRVVVRLLHGRICHHTAHTKETRIGKREPSGWGETIWLGSDARACR